MNNYDEYDDYDYDEYDTSEQASDFEDLDEDAQYEIIKKKQKKALIVWSSVLGAVILSGIIFISIVFSVLSSRKNRPQDVTSDDTSEYLEYKKGVLDARNEEEENTLTFTPSSLQDKNILKDILSDANVKVKRQHKHNQIVITSKKIFQRDDRVLNNDFDFKEHYNSQDKNYTVRIYFNTVDKDGNVKKFFIQRRFLINYEKILMVFDEADQLVDGYSKAEIQKAQGSNISEKIAKTIGREELTAFGFYKSSLRIEQIQDISDTNIQTAYFSRGEEFTKNTAELEDSDVYRINFRFDPSDSKSLTTRDNEIRNEDNSITLDKSVDNASKFSTWIKTDELQTNIHELGVNNLRDKINTPLFENSVDLSQYFESQKEWYLLNKNGTTHEDPEDNKDIADRNKRMWDPTNPFSITKDVVKKYGVFVKKQVKINDLGQTKEIKYYDLYFVATRKLKRMGLHYKYEENGKEIIKDEILETKDINGTDIDVEIPTIRNKATHFFAGFKPVDNDNSIWKNEKFIEDGEILKKGAKYKGLRPDKNKPYMEVEPIYKEFRKFDFYFDHPLLNKEAMEGNPELAAKFRMRLEDSETIKDRLENNTSLLKELNNFLKDTVFDDATKLNYYLEDTTKFDFSKTAQELFGTDYTKLLRVDMGRRYYTLNLSREVYEGKVDKEIKVYNEQNKQETELGIKRYPYVLGNEPKYSIDVFSDLKKVLPKEYIFYNLSEETLTSTDSEKGSNFPKQNQEIERGGKGIVNAILRLKPIKIKYLDSNNNTLTKKLSNKDDNFVYYYNQAITHEQLFDNLHFNKPDDNIHELFSDINKKLFYDKNTTIPVSEDAKPLDDKFINTNNPTNIVLELYIRSSIKKQTFTFKVKVQNPNDLDQYDLFDEFTYNLDYVKTKQIVSFNKYKIIEDNINRILGSERQFFENKDRKFEYIYNERDNATQEIDINFNRKTIDVSFKATHTFFDKKTHNAEARLTLTYGAKLTSAQISEVKDATNPINKVAENYAAVDSDDRDNFINSNKAQFAFVQALFGAQNIDLNTYAFKTPNAQYNFIFKAPTIDIEVIAAPNGDHDKYHTTEEQNQLDSANNNFQATKAFVDSNISTNERLKKYILNNFKKFTVEKDLIDEGKEKVPTQPVDLATYKDGQNTQPIGQLIKEYLIKNPQVNPDPEGRDFRGFYFPTSDEYRINRKSNRVGAQSYILQLRRKVIKIQYIANDGKIWAKPGEVDIKHTYGLYLALKNIFDTDKPAVDNKKSFYGWSIENFGKSFYNTNNPTYRVVISDQDASDLVLKFNIEQGVKQASIHTYTILSNEENNQFDPDLLALKRDSDGDTLIKGLLASKAKYFKEFGEVKQVAADNYFNRTNEEITEALKAYGSDYILDDSIYMDVSTTNTKSKGNYLASGFLIEESETEKVVHIYYYLVRKQYSVKVSKATKGNILKEQKYFLGANREGFTFPNYEDDDTYKTTGKYELDNELLDYNKKTLEDFFKQEGNKIQSKKDIEFIYKYELKEKYTITFEGRLFDLSGNHQKLDDISNMQKNKEYDRDAEIGSILDAYPSKTNYVFMGWYKDREMSKLLLKNDKAVKDDVVYAKFIRATHFGTEANSDIQIKELTGGGYSIEYINKEALLGANFGHLYIPKEINGTSVKEFGIHPSNNNNPKTFNNKFANSNINHIYLPSSIIQFRKFSFYNFTSIRDIRKNHTNENFSLGSAPNEIPDGIFYNCIRLNSFPYSDFSNTKKVSKNAFTNIRNKKISVNFPLLEYVGESAFLNFKSNITISSNLISAKDEAFRNSNINGNIYARNSKYIGKYSFENTHIKFIELAAETTIRYYAFNNCQLENVKFNNSIKYGEFGIYNLFSNNKKLKNINTDILTDFDSYVFEGCESLTKIDVKDGCDCISRRAFYKCINLSSINFKGSMKGGISGHATFAYTALNSFKMPQITNNYMSEIEETFRNNNSHAFTLDITNNPTKAIKFKSPTFGDNDSKYTKDNPFILNVIGNSKMYKPSYEFYPFGILKFNNTNVSQSTMFADERYITSNGYLTSHKYNNEAYNMYANWDYKFANNIKTLKTFVVATKVQANEFTFSSSIEELEHDSWNHSDTNIDIPAKYWLNDVNIINLNNIKNIYTKYFDNKDYMIKGNFIELNENDGRLYNKTNNTVINIYNYERFQNKELILTDDLYTPAQNKINRKKIIVRNYSGFLYNYRTEWMHFEDNQKFILKNKATTYELNGKTELRIEGPRGFYGPRLTFDASFNELKNHDIGFQLFLTDSNKDIDLTFFKYIIFEANETKEDIPYHNYNAKLSPNLKFIKGKFNHPSGRYDITTTEKLYFDLRTDKLKYLKIEAPELNLKDLGNFKNTILHLKTKITKFVKLYEVYYKEYVKLFIADLTDDSEVPSVLKDYNIKVLDLNDKIDWVAKGVKPENYHKVDHLYEANGMRIALLKTKYDSTTNIKRAYLYDVLDTVNPTLEIPESINYNGSTYKITDVHDELLKNNKVIEKIIFPSTVKNYGTKLFAGASNLKSVEFKSQIVNVSKDMFSENHKLTELKFSHTPAVLELEIGRSKNLEKVVLPSNPNFQSFGNTVINKNASVSEVMYALKSENYTIPFGVLGIGKQAFQGRTISKINLPQTINKLAAEAFDGATLPSRIEFEEGLEVLETKALNVVSNTEIILPRSVKKVGSNCFGPNTIVKFRGDKPEDFDEEQNNNGSNIEFNYQG